MKKNINLPVLEPVETTFKIISVILFLSLFLISCKSTEAAKASKKISTEGLHPVYITNTKKVNLLGPENMVGVVDQLQLLNGSFGQQSFSLLSYTQLDAKGINLSLINDFGADMGNLFYDGTKVIFDSAYFPKALPGEYIICDIQNAYYDEESLRKNYEAAGLEFEVWNGTGYNPAAGLNEKRLIRDGKKLIEEISILEDTITIKNYLRGYEYNLTRLEE